MMCWSALGRVGGLCMWLKQTDGARRHSLIAYLPMLIDKDSYSLVAGQQRARCTSHVAVRSWRLSREASRSRPGLSHTFVGQQLFFDIYIPERPTPYIYNSLTVQQPTVSPNFQVSSFHHVCRPCALDMVSPVRSRVCHSHWLLPTRRQDTSPSFGLGAAPCGSTRGNDRFQPHPHHRLRPLQPIHVRRRAPCSRAVPRSAPTITTSTDVPAGQPGQWPCGACRYTRVFGR